MFVLRISLALGILGGSLLSGEVKTFSKVERLKILDTGIELELGEGGLLRIDQLERGTVRVRMSGTSPMPEKPSGAIAATPVGVKVDVVEAEGDIVMRSALTTVTVVKATAQVTVSRTGDGSVVLQDTVAGSGWDTETGLIFTQKKAAENEAYFGLGARGGPVNRRGRRFVMNNVDRDAYGELSDPLYISIPYFYGVKDTKTWGLFLDNPAAPFFDMDSANNGAILFGASTGVLDYYVFTGPEPWTVSSAYGKLTGVTPLPPKWALGFHQSRYGYKTQKEFEDLADRLRSEKFPCDVLWFDIDYMKEYRNFTWNETAFPNPAAMNKRLAGQGFRSVNIVEPLYSVTDPNWYLLDLLGYLLKNPDGTSNVSSIWFGYVGFLDFSRTDASQWYQSQIYAFLRDYGVSGLWQDLNEPAQNYFPYVLHSFNGSPRPDTEARNVYALNMAKATWEAMTAYKPSERPWAISRSGYSGIQRYSANWSGDTLSSFDSLRVSLQMTINMAVSGQNFFGHDIGGFLGSPNYELYQRWLEFGSVIPLFRSHATDTTAPREPWSFGEANSPRIRDTIGFRYQLLPYIYSVFKEASDTGLPVVAPLWFYYTGDPATYTIDNSYLLGRDILVAPVTTEGARSREVYLPGGNDWVDFRSRKLYKGGQAIQVDAPLGAPPMFVRSGSVLPMGPVQQHTGDASAPGLALHIFQGDNPRTEVEIYEDDGISLDHLSGRSARTRFESFQLQDFRALIGQRATFGYQLPARRLTAVYYGVTKAPTRVELNGAALSRINSAVEPPASSTGWWYDAATQRLIVHGADREFIQLFML